MKDFLISLVGVASVVTIMVGLLSIWMSGSRPTEREREQWFMECEDRIMDEAREARGDGTRAACGTDMECELLDRRIQESCQL